MKHIFVCSPYRGDVERNTERAKDYCRVVMEAGAMPLCPHLYFTQFLDDDNPYERTKGLMYGLELLEVCNELWHWPYPSGHLSEGMEAEIQRAEWLGKKVVCMGG